MFDAIHKEIQLTFNAFGHHIPTLHGDAENINQALRIPFSKVGTNIVLSLPGDHAPTAEQATKTIQNRARSLTDSLPYYLPEQLTLLVEQAVGESLNHSTNKASYPQTPYEKTCGIKLTQQPVPFGRCAMVEIPDDKRLKISKITGIPLKKVPLTEIGVSMGLKPRTVHTHFLVQNGRVVPRRPIGPLLPKHFVPFGYIPKPTIYSGHPTQQLPSTPVSTETIFPLPDYDTVYEINYPPDTTPIPLPTVSPIGQQPVPETTPTYHLSPHLTIETEPVPASTTSFPHNRAPPTTPHSASPAPHSTVYTTLPQISPLRHSSNNTEDLLITETIHGNQHQ